MAKKSTWITFGLLLPSLVWAGVVYLKPDEALKLIFAGSKEIIAERRELSEAQRITVEARLGAKLIRQEWTFYLARSGGKVDGYALIDSEIGKTEPITFLTAILPDGSVKEVEILAYREPIGSEVHERVFLRQFEKKQGTDPVRVGQDIRNLTGATLSSRAVSNGVKRALVLWQTFYGK